MLTKQSEHPFIYTTFYSAIPFDVKIYTILILIQHTAALEMACWYRVSAMSVLM